MHRDCRVLKELAARMGLFILENLVKRVSLVDLERRDIMGQRGKEEITAEMGFQVRSLYDSHSTVYELCI